VDDSEILIQPGKQKNRKIYTRILHGKRRFLESGPLLLVLDLRFDNVGVRNLTGILLSLGYIHKTLCGLKGLLDRGVLALTRDQSVIVLRDSDRKTALRHFDLCKSQSLRGVRATDTGLVERIRIEFLVSDALLAVHMHTVIGHVPAARQDAI